MSIALIDNVGRAITPDRFPVKRPIRYTRYYYGRVRPVLLCFERIFAEDRKDTANLPLRMIESALTGRTRLM